MTIGSAGAVMKCHSETNADGQTQQTTTVFFQDKTPVRFADGATVDVVVVTPTWTPPTGGTAIFSNKADGDAKDARLWIAETVGKQFDIIGWREYAKNDDGRWREVWNEQDPA